MARTKKVKNVLTDITRDELQELKDENQEFVPVEITCIHQNQGEGKCLDCGVTIN